ncbi:hypothetical protein [Paenibacillus sp. Root52]|nr:hypothetical protein [Paenibacillus sp. Root52]
MFEWVHKEASVVVGMKWEGTFAEAGAGGIRVDESDLELTIFIPVIHK